MDMIADYGLKEKPGGKVEQKHVLPISECSELACHQNDRLRACV